MFLSNATNNSLTTTITSSLGKLSGKTSNTKMQHQTVIFDVFKDHWKQVLHIFNKSLINDDDIQIVKNNLAQMILLLVDELNTITNNDFKTNKQVNYADNIEMNSKFSGQLWDYLIGANIFETFYLWSLSYPEYLYDLKYEQLKHFENLIIQMQINEQTNLLLIKQLHRPLFSLLNHCATHNSELIERHMISILNQLCVCMCKNLNLLNIFFDNNLVNGGNGSNVNNGNGQATGQSGQNRAGNSAPTAVYFNHSQLTSSASMFLNENSNELILERSAAEKFYRAPNQSKSFIFNLLIPYIHKEGSLGLNCGSLTFGQQARDALLMIMQLSSRNPNLARYVVYSTDFCPILATGLSGLYSELPQKLTQHENFEEIRYLQKEDIVNIPSLNKFINSLEFCNNVIQVSHSLIANQLLQYVYYGFLVPVIAPALTQNCMDEIVSATLYLELFLRTINEPNLVKIFLKFILFSKFDERLTLLDTLINRINSSTKLSLATLMLFYTMIDINSEDVIYKLILTYIMPCKHLMKSQLMTLKQSSYEINGFNAQTFLSLSTNFSNFDANSNNSSTNNSDQTHSPPASQQPAMNLNYRENSQLYRWLNASFESTELSTLLAFLDNMRFNYVDYLKDAKIGILNTAEKTYKWSFKYDVVVNGASSSSLVSSSNTSNSVNLVSNSTSESSKKQPMLEHESTTTTNTRRASSKSANQPSNELDNDPEEFFLNLNLSTVVSDPTATKSTRSTMNLFSRDNTVNYETDSMMDFDLNSLNEAQPAASSSNPRTKTKSKSKPKSSGVEKKPSSKLRSRRRRNRALANDFYILSFDNEISETSSSSSSSSSSTSSLDKINDEDDDDDEELAREAKTAPENDYEEDGEDDDDDDEDEDLTETSLSSNTIYNDTNSLNQSSTADQPTVAPITAIDRLALVEFLFTNEENNKLYLNQNLNGFLNGLDEFFADKTHQVCSSNVDDLCSDIGRAYSEILMFETADSSATNATNNTGYKMDNLIVFPAYVANDSLQTSTQSLNTTSQAADSGIEMSNSACKEDDIGPFLCALFYRLDHMLNNSLQINFLITGILARLAYYPQLLLRSFLLNNNLVLQPNIRSLIQVLGNVKYKIDGCAKSYENFSLLYLKAKLTLVKRLFDTRTIRHHHNQIQNGAKSHEQQQPMNTSVAVPNGNQNNQTQLNKQPTAAKKKFTVDRFLSIFFKPSSSDLNSQQQQQQSAIVSPVSNNNSSRIQNPVMNGHLTTVFNAELDSEINKIKMLKNTKPSDFIQLQEINTNDFSIVDNDWEDIRTRNIAFSAVIFDEFVKELAAICQEHSILTQEM